MRGDISKLIFVDSSVNTHGDATTVLLPSHPFSADPGERMALSLQSFTMRRNWYNINLTNSGLFWRVDSLDGLQQINGTAFYSCRIEPSAVRQFETPEFADKSDDLRDGLGLAEILQNNLTQSLKADGIKDILDPNVTVEYNPNTRKLKIVYSVQTDEVANYLVTLQSFFIRDGAVPPGVKQTYNDAHVIFGSRPIEIYSDFDGEPKDNIKNLCFVYDDFLGTGSNSAKTFISQESYYPASLNTLEALYVRLNVETGNFMSPSFEPSSDSTDRVIESSFFARITFDDSVYNPVHEIIRYEDNGNDQYQTFLRRNTLDTISIRIVDHRGRNISEVAPLQADEGLMAFRMVLRWDLKKAPPTPVPPQIGYDRNNPPPPFSRLDPRQNP